MSSESHPEPHLIVDIGCGQLPFPLRPGGRQIEPGEEYRGYDLFEQRNIGPDTVNLFLRAALERSGGQGRVERADATRLPLGDEIADEVVMINLLSSPRVDRIAVAREVGRIIKRPSGIVTVVDTYAAASYPVHRVRDILYPMGLRQRNVGQELNSRAIGRYSEGRYYRDRYIALFGFPPSDVTNTPHERLHSGADCHSIDTSEKGGKTLMATAQQEYHGRVRQVKEGVTAEKGAMASAKSQAETSRERIAGVQTKWADFVTALATTRQSHTEFMGSLGAASSHHSEKVVPAQAQVNEKQGETLKLYTTLISDIRHQSIQQFAAVLGALGENVVQENGIVGNLTENYATMTADAKRREEALSQLQVAGTAYKENRLDPQQNIIASTPGHYEAQMGATDQANQALDTYIATT